MVAKMTGKKPKQPPEIPSSLAYLWSIFVSVKNGARDVIRARDIIDYQILSGVTLNAFEQSTVLELDAIYQEITSR